MFKKARPRALFVDAKIAVIYAPVFDSDVISNYVTFEHDSKYLCMFHIQQ